MHRMGNQRENFNAVNQEKDRFMWMVFRGTKRVESKCALTHQSGMLPQGSHHVAKAISLGTSGESIGQEKGPYMFAHK